MMRRLRPMVRYKSSYILWDDWNELWAFCIMGYSYNSCDMYLKFNGSAQQLGGEEFGCAAAETKNNQFNYFFY